MKLIRSWPRRLPAGRNYVIDDAERLVNDNYDYAGLAGLGDDIIHLDWDTVMTRECLVRFAELCRSEPDRVRVAPQRIYADSRRGLPETIWNLKRYEGTWMRYLRTGEPSCHLFGFGMVYLPQIHLRGYVEKYPGEVLSDISFSGWYQRTVEDEIPVAWDCETTHLHYRISDVVS